MSLRIGGYAADRGRPPVAGRPGRNAINDGAESGSTILGLVIVGGDDRHARRARGPQRLPGPAPSRLVWAAFAIPAAGRLASWGGSLMVFTGDSDAEVVAGADGWMISTLGSSRCSWAPGSSRSPPGAREACRAGRPGLLGLGSLVVVPDLRHHGGSCGRGTPRARHRPRDPRLLGRLDGRRDQRPARTAPPPAHLRRSIPVKRLVRPAPARPSSSGWPPARCRQPHPRHGPRQRAVRAAGRNGGEEDVTLPNARVRPQPQRRHRAGAGSPPPAARAGPPGRTGEHKAIAVAGTAAAAALCVNGIVND